MGYFPHDGLTIGHGILPIIQLTVGQAKMPSGVTTKKFQEKYINYHLVRVHQAAKFHKQTAFPCPKAKRMKNRLYKSTCIHQFQVKKLAKLFVSHCFIGTLKTVHNAAMKSARNLQQ